MTHMEFFILMIYRKHNKTGSCRIPVMQFSNLDESNSNGRSWSRISIFVSWQIGGLMGSWLANFKQVGDWQITKLNNR